MTIRVFHGARVLLPVLMALEACRCMAAPVIDSLSRSTTPAGGQSVTVQVSVISSVAVSLVQVEYSANAWTSMQSAIAWRQAGAVYAAKVPGFAAGVTVAYTARATDALGGKGNGPTNKYTVDAGIGPVTVTCRVCSANTTSGNYQAYEDPGIRIFQGLRPDVVGIQEFNYRDGTLRELVDTAFGTGFYFYVEPGDEQIPNGVISRWPIKAAGQWEDPLVSNRDYVWATLDVPGTVDMHVVSVHLLTDDSKRPDEATNLSALIAANFPASDYVVLAGDLNTDSRTEQTVSILLATPLSDNHKPADQAGDQDTNSSRSKPYDYVLPNPTLSARHTATRLEGKLFANGLVYDSRVTTPYALRPSPIEAGDSGVAGMQHMAVVKDYVLPVGAGGAPPPTLVPVGSKEVYVGETLGFGVTGTITAGTWVTVSCSRASLFVSQPGVGMAAGMFEWSPQEPDIGDHAVVFTAAAQGKIAQEMINIRVLPEPGAWLIVLAAGLLRMRMQMAVQARH